MRRERIEAAQMVAPRLFEAEAALDAALSTQAGLLAAIIGARRHANLALEVGQDAVEANLAAMSTLGAVRRSLIAAHSHLADVQISIGLRTVAIGDGGEKPKQGVPQLVASPPLAAAA